MREIFIDIEANALKNPTLIHCIVCKDRHTGERFKFRPRSPFGGHHEFGEAFKEFIKTCSKYIGHNIIGYDIPVMNDLLGLNITVDMVEDTLVLSRLFRPVSPEGGVCKEKGHDNRVGGHSLEAWGRRLNFHKGEFNEWESFSETMLDYCTQDVDVTERVYKQLMEVESIGFSSESIRLEHDAAYWLDKMVRNGFYLDQDKARAMRDSTAVELEKMNTILQHHFPPKKKLINVYTPKYTKSGELGAVSKRIISNPLAEQNKDGSYNIYTLETFNPASPNQVVDRLLGLGWKPTKMTPAGKPSANKEALQRAIEEFKDNPAVAALGKYNIIANRYEKACKWLELVEEDGRVHGKINPIGAGTHRCAHYDDNMANIARVSTGKMPVDKFTSKYGDPNIFIQFSPFAEHMLFLHADDKDVEFALTGVPGGYGWDSRDCWAASSDETCMVGADASGIQLRSLAHYMNDKEYIHKLLNDDIHVVNQKAAGLPSRSKAKTFIYSWIMGAGDEKIGIIVGVDASEYEELFAYGRSTYVINYYKMGDRSQQNLLQFTSDSLRRKGRKVTKQLVATVLKGHKVKDQFLNSIPALKRLKEKDIPAAAKQGFIIGLDGRKVWVPSEHLTMPAMLQSFEAIVMKKATHLWSTKLTEMGIPFKLCAFVHDEWCVETPIEYGDVVGKAMVQAIRDSGEILGSVCPLDGEYKIGRAWSQIH